MLKPLEIVPILVYNSVSIFYDRSITSKETILDASQENHDASPEESF
jgi:hypothetical protein